jgi:hypothetical protein
LSLQGQQLLLLFAVFDQVLLGAFENLALLDFSSLKTMSI